MKLHVVVEITVDNNFVEESLIHMGYKRLPPNSEQPQQRFFEKTLKKEEISGICNIGNLITNIPGIIDVNFIHPTISENEKKYLHPIAFILYLTMANILGLILVIENIETEYKITMSYISIISILVIPTIIYILVEAARYAVEK